VIIVRCGVAGEFEVTILMLLLLGLLSSVSVLSFSSLSLVVPRSTFKFAVFGWFLSVGKKCSLRLCAYLEIDSAGQRRIRSVLM